MDSPAIRRALKDKGLNYRMVSEAIGRAYNFVSLVANRKATSKPVAKALAKAIDKPVEEVFPDKPSYWEEEVPRKERVAQLAEMLSDESAAA